MNVYTTDKIRNVVLLGHGGSGKTTIVEAMAYLSGITNRMGTVTDGNTISDYDKEEIKRKFSITHRLFPLSGRIIRSTFSIRRAILILWVRQRKQHPQQTQPSSWFPVRTAWK